MTGICCSKRTLLSGLALAVWVFAFDFLVHGHLLQPLYEATAEHWRPMEEMQSMFIWCVIYHLVMGLLVACGYYCWRSKVFTAAVGSSECPIRKSMGFGLWVGVLLGVPQLMNYMWMDIPLELPLGWAASEIVKWTLGGLLLAKLYR